MTEKKKDPEFDLFFEAHLAYPGMKRFVMTEFKHLKAEHDDWKEVLPMLKAAIEAQKAEKERRLKAGEFSAEWKHFSKWIEGRWWEVVPAVPVIPEVPNNVKIPYF